MISKNVSIKDKQEFVCMFFFIDIEQKISNLIGEKSQSYLHLGIFMFYCAPNMDWSLVMRHILEVKTNKISYK